ncbi:hypothetical protein GF362_06800 [Candidatus Dojkabacteria bacterium]|nr:hypothetical protein [Candidatus Dojkabacteria bacterium]
MKKIKNVSFFLVFFIAFSIFSPILNVFAEEVNMTCNGIFPDLQQGHSLCPYVEYMVHQNILSGYSNGNFGPDDPVTRGQIAKIIKEAFNIPTDTSGEQFPDIPETHPFFEQIQSIKNAGIAKGFGDGEYKAEESVSRGALMKLAVLGVDVNKEQSFFTEPTGSISDYFPDVSADHAFVEYILTGVENNIISGYQDGTFKPELPMTRAQIAKVITNLIKAAGYEDVECVEYYCQDKFVPFYDGQYFTLSYQGWTISEEVKAEILEGFENQEEIPFTFEILPLEKSEEEIALFMALDMQQLIDFMVLTMEAMFEAQIQMAIESGATQEEIDQMRAEFDVQIDDMRQEMEAELNLEQAFDELVAEIEASAGTYYSSELGQEVVIIDYELIDSNRIRMQVEFTDPETNEQYYGYMEYGLNNNVMAINFAFVHDETKLGELAELLNNFTFK